VIVGQNPTASQTIKPTPSVFKCWLAYNYPYISLTSSSWSIPSMIPEKKPHKEKRLNQVKKNDIFILG
jgi:hypothetical protein